MLNWIEFNSNSNDKTNKKWSAGGWEGGSYRRQGWTPYGAENYDMGWIWTRTGYRPDNRQQSVPTNKPSNLKKKKLTLISLVQCI